MSPLDDQPEDRLFRVSATNINGLGAIQLVASLLPHLENALGFRLHEIYLPDHGPLSTYRPQCLSTRTIHYRRHLPNAISRVLECTLLGHRYNGRSPLLVLGDIPVRCDAAQVVFVQTTNMTRTAIAWNWRDKLKYEISRLIFRANLSRIAGVVVQTDTMMKALVGTFPSLDGKIHIIPQPPPSWLMPAKAMRSGRRGALDAPLRVFYPACRYPHKNHTLLKKIAAQTAQEWPIENLTLTIAPDENPAVNISWVSCTGQLGPEEILEHYRQDDALLFLSKSESYGFPLVEAMWVGIPIVCPDLPYARSFCGDTAIYFDPDDISSLKDAIDNLRSRLELGWWPDWSLQLNAIPTGWNEVAVRMLDVVGQQAKRHELVKR